MDLKISWDLISPLSHFENLYYKIPRNNKKYSAPPKTKNLTTNKNLNILKGMNIVACQLLLSRIMSATAVTIPVYLTVNLIKVSQKIHCENKVSTKTLLML